MFSGLIRNVAISAAAFGAVSVVGLLLVPVLIHAYGIAGFGQIALARLFLPVAALALFDMGYAEIATHAVASARGNEDWSRCTRLLTLDLLLALCVGSACGLCLWIAAPAIPAWTSVPPADAQPLAMALRATAAALPLLFASMVFEGVLKGYENFGSQRSIEVVAALAYAALALAAVQSGMGLLWICLALLASLVLRALLAGVFAYRMLAATRTPFMHWTPEVRSEFAARARVLSNSKVLGAIQANAPSVIVSAAIGPAGLGVYDVLSRMPRFAKAVLGLLSSTVQPVAVRLEALPDGKDMARLGRLGLLLVGAVTAPVLGATMSFSEPILRLWLAPSIAVLWPWQAIYFVIPSLGALVGFGASALLSRRSVVGAMNRLTLVHIAVTLGVGAASLGIIQERGFVASQFAATLVTFPLYMRIIQREMDIPISTFLQLARIFAVALAMTLPTLMLASRIDSLLALIACLGTWIVLCWAACLMVALDRTYRHRVLQEARQRLKSLTGHRNRP